MPRSGGTTATLRLSSSLEGALHSGHPWIYRNHLPPHRLRGNEVVRVEAGSAASYGVYDADSAIAVRLFGPQPNSALLEQRVGEALALRAGLASAGGDAYRLLFGEGDYLPGIVCDRYGRYAVMRCYATSMEQFLAPVAKLIGSALNLRGVALRAGRDDEADSDGQTLTALWGELPPPELTVTENSLKFITDPWRGQKTGMFLDQRDNRQLVRGLSDGKRVLNLFAYSGGFSVYALAGGASTAVSVDISKQALEAAERNVALNLAPGQHSALVADIFDSLPRWVEQAARYDMVILDPPSLANNASQRRRAQRAYLRLNRDAMRLVEPGGLLVTASCTAQVAPDQFREVVAEAARAAAVRVQVIAENAHALDHPVPLSFPEGRYLKFMVMRVLP